MNEERPALVDGEMPSAPPTPPIRILTYDGQELLGRVHRRWQGSTGIWFYECSVTLWGVTQLGSRDVAEPADITINVPSTHVRPVAGIAYSGVPLIRHRDAVARSRTRRTS